MRRESVFRPMASATNLVCLLMIEESILFWNCRGAGSNCFLCEMKELMKEHRPSIVILLKPRISGDKADGVCKKLGRGERVLWRSLGVVG